MPLHDAACRRITLPDAYVRGQSQIIMIRLCGSGLEIFKNMSTNIFGCVVLLLSFLAQHTNQFKVDRLVVIY